MIKQLDQKQKKMVKLAPTLVSLALHTMIEVRQLTIKNTNYLPLYQLQEETTSREQKFQKISKETSIQELGT